MATKKKAVENTDLPKRFGFGTLFLVLAFAVHHILAKGEGLSDALLSSQMGVIGSFIYRVLKSLTGSGSSYIPVLFIIYAIFMFIPKLKAGKKQYLSVLVIFITLLGWSHLGIKLSDSIQSGFSGFGGGIIGALISYLFIKLIGPTITKIIFLAVILFSLVIGTDGKIFYWLKNFGKNLRPFCSESIHQIKGFIFSEETEEDLKAKEKKKPRFAKLKNQKPFDADAAVKSSLKKEEKPLKIKHAAEKRPEKDFMSNVKDIQGDLKETDKQNRVKSYIEENQYEPQTFSMKDKVYELPTVDLLEENKNPVLYSDKEVEKNVEILTETLANFGVDGNVTEVSVGPTVTEFEFQPAPGIKVSKILNLADDIAMNLAANDVRIQAPIPGKAAVGIEVPNKKKSSVALRDIIESHSFQDNPSKLTAALGKDISGNVIVADLAQMPHLLIAGSTGSGKSVCINTLILSILFKAHPDEVKFLMIDPKMVELTGYNDIPHLISPVVTDTKKAAGTLQWAVREMENRYNAFAETGVKDLERYNKKVIENLALGVETERKTFPRILIIIDELADLMMVAPAEVEDAICRLAQMARAAGIHLVIATQRPSVDVITGIIKANIPSRIAFSVSSQIDSRTILDMGGAEKLLGRGDMLFYPRGTAKPVRVQGCYVSDAEIERVVEEIKEQGNPKYEKGITQFAEEITTSVEEAPEEELLGPACELFIRNGQASISMLQRNFRIGYTRAARIIDTLAELGYIGPYEGSKPRKVNITLSEWEKIFGSEGYEGD